MYLGWKNGFKGALTTIDSTATGDPGEFRQENGNIYQYVKNGSAGTFTVGAGVVLTAGASDATVTNTCVANDSIFGVPVAAITTLAYGFVIKHGIAEVKMAATASCSAGAYLGVTTNGTFTPKVSVTVSGTAGYLGNLQVKALDAIASGATGTAFISCM